MVIPIAFAVLRLMMSSTLVGSSIGRSPGFAPLRQQQRLRDRRAECLLDFQVDHQLGLGRLLDKQVGGSGADGGPVAQLTASQLV